MSSNYMVQDEAYLKMMLHAAKYPEYSVNGILVGKPQGQVYEVVDAFPLFHQQSLAPMLEAACMFIEQHCLQNDLQIVGYYHANERSDDRSLNPVAQKIADKIESQCTRACSLLIKGDELNNPEKMGLQLMLKDVKRGWVAVNDRLSLSDPTSPELFTKAVKNGSHFELYDFDDHFDDISRDWRNPSLSKLLKIST